MTRHRFFLGYAYDLFRRGAFYTAWQNLLKQLRRIRLIAFLVRVLTVFLSLLQTGALVLLATVLFLILLPIGSSLMLGILLTALIESRQTNRRLRNELANKNVYILFAYDPPSPFLFQNAADLSAHKDTAVLIVSPYWISGKGIKKGRFYCTARQEAEGIYLIRRYYFFSLKKHVLPHTKITYIY